MLLKTQVRWGTAQGTFPEWKIIACPRLPCMVNFPLATATEGDQRNATRSVSRSPSVPVISTIASGLHLLETVKPDDAPSTVLFPPSRTPGGPPSRKNDRGKRTMQLWHQIPTKPVSNVPSLTTYYTFQ